MHTHLPLASCLWLTALTAPNRQETRLEKIGRWLDEFSLFSLPTPLALLGGPFTTNIPQDEERAAQELHRSATLARGRSM